jgi:DNA-binding CsgD family transcriptional regulator
LSTAIAERDTRMEAQELSDRERGVLLGIAADKTYAQIAHDMGVSHETVKSYANRLRAKLGINSKIGLALWAERNLGGKDNVDGPERAR